MSKDKILTTQEEYQDTLVFNNAIREIFLNRFVQLFSGYEHFVIHPSQVLFNLQNSMLSRHFLKNVHVILLQIKYLFTLLLLTLQFSNFNVIA